jgi:hypothetical protein
MLNVVVGMQEEDGIDRVLDVLARPVRGHRVHGRVLAGFGRACAGQCQALAMLGCVPSVSLSYRDAPGQGEEVRGWSERVWPKLAGCA